VSRPCSNSPGCSRPNLRGSDHLSLQQQGYPSARLTEPRENFDHEHQNTQVLGGVQFGDLIQYVDFKYVARVAGVNAAALWALATCPSTPKNAQIHTTPPGTLSGTNLTTLTWNANPETNLAGYEVVMRRPRRRTGRRRPASATSPRSRSTSPRTTCSSASAPWPPAETAARSTSRR
jgi:hypothetical protein